MTSIRLILTNLTNNENKWWNGTVDGVTVKLEWGRVGESGQSTTKTFPTAEKAEKFYQSKCREKLGKGYTEQKTIIGSGTVTTVATSIGHVARQQIAHSDNETRALIDFLVKQNIHVIEGATSIKFRDGQATTPLGPVTGEGLDEAARLLEEVAVEVEARRFNGKLEDLVNRYMRIVPRSIGRRKIEARDVFPSVRRVQEEKTLLDALRAVVVDATQNAVTDAPVVFRTKLEIVSDTDSEFTRLDKLYRDTLNARHTSARLQLKRVWRVTIAGADEAFEGHLRNVREGWHGSNSANLLSILKSGYMLPRSVATARLTGAMFGPGIYTSPQSTKSLNYATGFWGGGRSTRCFMLLNDVALGHRYFPTRSFSNRPAAEYDSACVKGGTCGVLNDEWIVYRTSQIRPKFLCEFS